MRSSFNQFGFWLLSSIDFFIFFYSAIKSTPSFLFVLYPCILTGILNFILPIPNPGPHYFSSDPCSIQVNYYSTIFLWIALPSVSVSAISFIIPYGAVMTTQSPFRMLWILFGWKDVFLHFNKTFFFILHVIYQFPDLSSPSLLLPLVLHSLSVWLHSCSHPCLRQNMERWGVLQQTSCVICPWCCFSCGWWFSYFIPGE